MASFSYCENFDNWDSSLKFKIVEYFPHYTRFKYKLRKSQTWVVHAFSSTQFRSFWHFNLNFSRIVLCILLLLFIICSYSKGKIVSQPFRITSKITTSQTHSSHLEYDKIGRLHKIALQKCVQSALVFSRVQQTTCVQGISLQFSRAVHEFLRVAFPLFQETLHFTNCYEATTMESSLSETWVKSVDPIIFLYFFLHFVFLTLYFFTMS